ncbi:uncharacterized protein LOC133730740 [Rosa rugosa]|uniref:uncharacterized protein LOC133730740 n=1 Tax=Rosa rugosa TaxID=74645 RepID=UPI002B40B484|nr:uncharacterized protein LOC133730740 [Rosa rugosa]
MEVELIARIPLSLRDSEDRLIWHYDKKGCYTVRNGYHVARVATNHVSRASSSSGSVGVQGKYWRCIWNARIPPKGIHLFRDCDVIGWLWMESTLGLKVKNVPGRRVEEWVLNVIDILHGGQRDLFFMVLWVIWTERNNAIWNGTSFNACNAAKWTVTLLDDYQKQHPAGFSKHARPKAKWQLPPTGRLKINVDGSYRPECGDGGIGVVVRDEVGNCIAAMARYYPHVLSAIHMEAEACRAGILLAIHQYWNAFDLESDCSLVVAALQLNVEDRSEIRHIFREANGVANRLAHLASLNYLDDIWLEESPMIIQDVLYEDSCTTARGQAINVALVRRWTHIWLETDSILALRYFKNPGLIPWRLRTSWLNCLHKVSQITFRMTQFFREGNALADKFARYGASNVGAVWWRTLPSSFLAEFGRDLSSRINYRFS